MGRYSFSKRHEFPLLPGIFYLLRAQKPVDNAAPSPWVPSMELSRVPAVVGWFATESAGIARRRGAGLDGGVKTEGGEWRGKPGPRTCPRRPRQSRNITIKG